jgi:hypothetical protein
MDRPRIQRRGFLMAAAATGAVAAGGAHAQNTPGSVQTDNAPKELAGKLMPEPCRHKVPGRLCRGADPTSREKSRS